MKITYNEISKKGWMPSEIAEIKNFYFPHIPVMVSPVDYSGKLDADFRDKLKNLIKENGRSAEAPVEFLLINFAQPYDTSRMHAVPCKIDHANKILTVNEPLYEIQEDGTKKKRPFREELKVVLAENFPDYQLREDVAARQVLGKEMHCVFLCGEAFLEWAEGTEQLMEGKALENAAVAIYQPIVDKRQLEWNSKVLVETAFKKFSEEKKLEKNSEYFSALQTLVENCLQHIDTAKHGNILLPAVENRTLKGQGESIVNNIVELFRKHENSICMSSEGKVVINQKITDKKNIQEIAKSINDLLNPYHRIANMPASKGVDK